MVWAAGVIVIIGVGLPLGAWLLTRRLARRPAGKFGTGDRLDDWLRREYGLAWLERTQVRTAVTQGSRVGDPRLEGAAHELAARMLSGDLPGLWHSVLLGKVNLGLGLILTALGVIDLVRHPSQTGTVILIPEGMLLAVNGWLTFVWLPKRRRRAAARARELNLAPAVRPS